MIEFDETTNYYDKFWKEYLMAVTFIKRMRDFENHVQELESSVGEI